MSARRIAVLVDGDNISASHAPKVLAEAARLGRVDIARVYAALNQPSDWLRAQGYRLLHAGAGKNAADLLLSIDAMELALESGVESFVIASSDGDFTHLAQRLRERGLHVLGLGENKAPMGFRLACTEFHCLEEGEPKAAPPAEENPADCADLDLKIRSMIARYSTNGTGMRIAELGPQMHRTHAVRISTLPERTWRAYLSSRPALYQLDPKSPEAKVRFRPEGFAALQSAAVPATTVQRRG
ncbi:NYN domain-containing protein [Frigidibacter sp. ROC022]|uniref:NYN domain-containing protein n=1 Tax=Frigidibacter sp. ROC022 TaxID=2971796 RepID=UPI00215B13DB|nr:NYN domain-containing protein [Frigidibacter sp. ROC022]MCR8725038.1 NYN domain-containing protein [Frigidibacter sp. ROC022]